MEDWNNGRLESAILVGTGGGEYKDEWRKSILKARGLKVIRMRNEELSNL